MEYKLKDIITFKPGYAFKKSDMADTGIDLIKIGNLKNNKVIIPSDAKIKEDIKFKDFIINKNDILMALTGDPVYKGNIQTWVGRTSMYLNNKIAYLNQRVCKLIPNEKIILGDYLYYWLIRYDKTYEIAGLFHGSANQANISHKEVGEMFIELPKLDIQKKIAKILTDIDKKIKLNSEINDNLYELAISYLNKKSESNEVPISNFAKIQGGYAFKSKDLIDESTSNRVIKIKNLRSEISADVLNSQFVEDDIVKKIDKKFKLNDGDVTIAMTGAELGKTGFIYGNDDYYLNQRVGVIRGHNEKKELYLKILFLSDDFQMLLNSKGYGSAQPNISTSDIENIYVKDINEDNLNDFYKNIKPIYESIISNCKEILILEQLRDTLLPKLMNGEIDLENVEI